MKLVIIESPFAGNTAENIEYARKCVLDSLNRGESPIASHLVYTQVLDDTDLKQRTQGITAGIAWYKVADLCAVYTDKDITPGMQQGIEMAAAHKIKVEYRSIF